MQVNLAELKIVLVDTTHPGNIGAVARAMKNMGLRQLVLVRPRKFPHAEATARAAGAADVLQQAVVCDSLDEALADCQFLLGSSARPRTLEWPMLTVRAAARETATQLRQGISAGHIAVLFGTESVGLSNEQLQRCHYRVEIPTNPDYSSLNLAQAVQVVSYELRMALSTLADSAPAQPDTELADARSVESFLQRMQQMITALDVLNPAQPAMLSQRLRRLFMRARLEASEVNIFQGIISAVLKLIESDDSKRS